MGETPKWIAVDFAGHGRFYVEEDVLRGERSGPLEPDDHITDGELDWSRCFHSDSYAHVYPGAIMRFRQKIGVLSDLIPVGRIAVVEHARLALPAKAAVASSDPSEETRNG